MGRNARHVNPASLGVGLVPLSMTFDINVLFVENRRWSPVKWNIDVGGEEGSEPDRVREGNWRARREGMTDDGMKARY
jgi:hypothetical protein